MKIKSSQKIFFLTVASLPIMFNPKTLEAGLFSKCFSSMSRLGNGPGLKTKLELMELAERNNPYSGSVFYDPSGLPTEAVLATTNAETGAPIPGTRYTITDPVTRDVLVDITTDASDPVPLRVRFTNPSDYVQTNYREETRTRTRTETETVTDYSNDPPTTTTYTYEVPYTETEYIPYDTYFYQTNYNVDVTSTGYRPKYGFNVTNELGYNPPTLFLGTSLEKVRVPEQEPFNVRIGEGASVYAASGDGFIKVYDRNTGAEIGAGNPFPGFKGNVSVAVGDINGDGTQDIIAGAGAGGGPRVTVFNGKTGQVLNSFFAYEPTFRDGISSVNAADFNGDGKAEIAVGAGVGGGPRVSVFDVSSGNAIAIRDFFAYESSFRGGVNVSLGDTNGDGKPDIIAGSGPGGGPRVRVFDGNGSNTPIEDFFAYDSSFRGGVNVAYGPTSSGSASSIVAGAGIGGGPDVRVFDSQGRNGSPPQKRYGFFAFEPSERGGVNVGVSGSDLILAAPKSNGPPIVETYNLQNGDSNGGFFIFEIPELLSGYNVAGSR